MRLIIFGPTGGTGEQLVRQALATGHHVIAVARRPEAVTVTGPRLEVVRGDVSDQAWTCPALEGADAAISALGSQTLGQPTTLYSTGAAAILAAMVVARVTRFVGVTATPVEPDSQKSLLDRYVAHPLLHRFFGPGYEDMRRMEDLLVASQIDWTVFRPPRLTDKPPKGRYRTAVGQPLARAWNLTRADLAAAMLASLDDPALSRRAVTIAN